MDHETFINQLIKIKDFELPGERAHERMSPPLRKRWAEANDTASLHPKRAGVLALFYPDEQRRTHLLMMLRKTYPGVHSNQVGFPGGKTEPGDRDLLDTAKRECEEEVGVPGSAYSVVRELSELYIPPSNFTVRPYIAYSRHRPAFVADPVEVERLIEVPWTEVVNPAIRFSTTIDTAYAQGMEVPAYRLQGHTVWGATAMMLSEIEWLLDPTLGSNS